MDSRAQPLGQLLMIRLVEDRWTSTLERSLRRRCPGGILLGGRHLRSPEATAELLRKLWLALPVPPFLALEEEGGAFDPLRAIFPALPSPHAGAQKGISATRRLGELAGSGLRLLGFNTNLAPWLGLSAPSLKSSQATRAFAINPHQVAQSAEAFVRGLERHKILACAKYFPALGSAEIRGHSEPPPIAKTMAELWRRDLIPFRALLPHLPLVLVGHSAFKSFDYDLPRPASLSENIVEGLLRTKLAYRGVAVADDLDAEVLRRTAELGELAVRSVRAGCDLLRVGGREKCIEEALAGLRRGIEMGMLSTRRVEKALARLRLAKKGLPPASGKVSRRAFLQLARQFEDFSKQCCLREQKIA